MVDGVNYHSFPRTAVRFFFRIILGIVFCIVAYGTFFSIINAEWYQRILSVLTFVLLLYMIYSGMWSAGVHDRDEIYFERMKRDPYRGLAVSAVVSIPYTIINAILLISCINAASIEKYDLSRLIYHLINAPFLFITFNYDYHNIGNALIAGILLPLTIIVFGGISYYLGLKNISILQMSVYKDEDNKDHQDKKEGH